MTDSLLLDTHTWLWIALEDERITPSLIPRFIGAGATGSLYVSAYSLFEVAYSVRRKRIRLSVPLAEWFGLSFVEWGIKILPLTPEVAAASASLPEEFHGDPGDRVIAATAVTHGITLCTHDHALIRFGKQGLFDFLEV